MRKKLRMPPPGTGSNQPPVEHGGASKTRRTTDDAFKQLLTTHSHGQSAPPQLAAEATEAAYSGGRVAIHDDRRSSREPSAASEALQSQPPGQQQQGADAQLGRRGALPGGSTEPHGGRRKAGRRSGEPEASGEPGLLRDPVPTRDERCCKRLPLELWARIFAHLAASLEPPGGLRGPGVVAADIARTGLACRDTLRAAEAGLRALAAAAPIRPGVPPLPPAPLAQQQAPAARALAAAAAVAPVRSAPEPDWALLDTLLAQSPSECEESKLRDALRQLGQPTDGSGRAELVVRLRSTLGLAAAAAAAAAPPPRPSFPARLSVALLQEREARCDAPVATSAPAEALNVRLAAALRDLVEAGDALAGAALAQPCLAAMRRDLCALYGSTAGLLAAHRACLPRLVELRRRRAEERRRAAEAWRREEAERAAALEAALMNELAAKAADDRAERERRAADVQSRREERVASFAMRGFADCVCGGQAARACALALCSRCCRQQQATGSSAAAQACPRHAGCASTGGCGR
ncbi:hypothetical protein PLESTB_000276800 [Pleodorina starrii]|uniref:Uncharacterized protein n=1 Tax=Pleodorina starrii TaxID=330485 RepID=A0A9W6EYX7_9CHLO|nr:hypothetical protein PLESTB_000276800 [Pleodorina starrii]